MTAAQRPSDLPPLGPASRFFLWLILGWYKLSGWRAEGRLPDDPKLVIIGAPHTSNWDFLVFLGTVDAVGRQVRFIGKSSLFRPPFGGFFRALGGVPVDRGRSQDLVSQVADQFAAHDDFCLIVAAEGTRSYTREWKKGFYHIARKAGVRIVCAGPDYPAKRGIYGPVITPTGDFDRDMAPAFKFFRSLRPKFPERAGFPDEGTGKITN